MCWRVTKLAFDRPVDVRGGVVVVGPSGSGDAVGLVVGGGGRAGPGRARAEGEGCTVAINLERAGHSGDARAVCTRTGTVRWRARPCRPLRSPLPEMRSS